MSRRKRSTLGKFIDLFWLAFFLFCMGFAFKNSIKGDPPKVVEKQEGKAVKLQSMSSLLPPKKQDIEIQVCKCWRYYRRGVEAKNRIELISCDTSGLDLTGYHVRSFQLPCEQYNILLQSELDF